MRESVPADEVVHVHGKPTDAREIEELDLTKQGCRDGIRRESPGQRVAAELEPRQQESPADLRSRAGDPRQVLEDVRRDARRNRDPHETVLGVRGDELAGGPGERRTSWR
jgi:hypothetical protein